MQGPWFVQGPCSFLREHGYDRFPGEAVRAATGGLMQGRCAGCGEEGTYKASLAHVGRCPRFAELFVNDPARALDPGEEFRRVAADRKAEPVAVKPQVAPAEVSVAPVTVAPKQSPRRVRKAPAPVAVEPLREPGPVMVEHWVVPRGLLDTASS